MLIYPFRSAFIAAASISLAACGGGGGGVNTASSVPLTSPPPAPSPPSPPPPPTIAIPAAALSTSPAQPLAAGTKFSTLSQSTGFPLLMTAAIGGTGDGDPATTTAGGSLSVAAGQYRLTVNNITASSNLPGITDLPIAFSGVTTGAGLIQSSLDGSDLDYTRYGYWARGQVTEGMFNVGAWTTGFSTPTAQIPTQGTATYSGTASGLYNAQTTSSPFVDFDNRISGKVTLTANFTQSSLAGAITNISAANLYNGSTGPVNDIAFSATIDRNANLFAGSTTVTSQPGGVYAFGPSASGLINGRFYGPNASEVGAVFNVTEGARRLVGSFGAKQ